MPYCFYISKVWKTWKFLQSFLRKTIQPNQPIAWLFLFRQVTNFCFIHPLVQVLYRINDTSIQAKMHHQCFYSVTHHVNLQLNGKFQQFNWQKPWRLLREFQWHQWSFWCHRIHKFPWLFNQEWWHSRNQDLEWLLIWFMFQPHQIRQQEVHQFWQLSFEGYQVQLAHLF